MTHDSVVVTFSFFIRLVACAGRRVEVELLRYIRVVFHVSHFRNYMFSPKIVGVKVALALRLKRLKMQIFNFCPPSNSPPDGQLHLEKLTLYLYY